MQLPHLGLQAILNIKKLLQKLLLLFSKSYSQQWYKVLYKIVYLCKIKYYKVNFTLEINPYE